MKTKLICPALRPSVAGLARRSPLGALPLLGSSPLGAELSALYVKGVREVEVVAADRPEIIRALLGNGDAWGLRVTVTPAVRESSMENAESLDGPGAACDGSFESYRAWFETVQALFAGALGRRVGMREIAPNICVHARAEIAPTAQLNAPCWIGENTRIGPDCNIGPGAYIEDNCCVETGVSVEDSWVGPGTYVGAFTDLLDSLVWGRWLCKWTTGATTDVQDPFLLGEMPARANRLRGRFIARTVAAMCAVLTIFVPLIAFVLSVLRKRPFFSKFQAVVPGGGIVTYAELSGFRGWPRRWPRLLSILKGDFGWVGNPPLSPGEAGALLTEYERMWYAVRPGLVSLADVFGVQNSRDETAVAHSSYFSACTTTVGNFRIFWHLIGRAFGRKLVTLRSVNSKTNEDFFRRNHPSHH